MNDYHDRQDEPHQGEDRPVAGWPGHNPDEHTGEHAEEQAGEPTGAQAEDPGDETRDEEEPLVGEVWNDDATGEREPGWSGEHNGPSDVSAGESADGAEETEGAEETKRDRVAEPFGTEEPMIVTESADDESDGVAAEPAASEPVAVEDPPETAGPAEEPAVEPVAVAEPVAAEPGTETETEPEVATAEAAETGARPAAAGEFNVEYLVEPAAAERLRNRWRDVKAVFVDDPADAVRQAGALTGEAVDELTAALSRLRQELDDTSGEGREADTERLRVALRGYGALIDRILTR